MGISLGLVGLGGFGSAFADLFKSHPLVDRIALCDCEPERIAQFARKEFWKDKFNEKDVYASFDEICKSDAGNYNPTMASCSAMYPGNEIRQTRIQCGTDYLYP